MNRIAATIDRRRAWPRVAAVALAALAFVLASGLLDGGEGVRPSHLFTQPLYVLANALPGLLLAALLLVLSRRLLLSFGLAFLLQALLYGINALKLGNLGTPLMPADFRFVSQLRRGGTHLLSGYLPHSPWPYLALLGGVALLAALVRLEPPILPRRTHGKRLVAGGALAAGLGSLLAGVSAWAHVYDHNRMWMEPWSASSTAAHSGLVNSLMMYHLQYGKTRQKPDPSAAKQLLGGADQALRQRLRATPAGELPDIVVVQSESFFDPSIMKGYEHSDLAPNLHRLAQQGVSGQLHVPTYGGGTIRTEFEALTGLSLRYFGDMQFPYLQMNTKVVPGLVRTLRAHGYETVAVHGNDPSFWNRDNAFKAIGFDRFVSQSSFPKDAPMDGKYMADRAMTDEIMTQLKNAGPPQFLFAISLEAHGPYDESPGIDTAAQDAIPVPAGVDGLAKRELQNYLYHMRHADAELGRLADLLARRERPTLLMFYGDHLPGLTGAFRATGFVDGGDMLGEPGTWLLVDPRQKAPAERQDLAAWMLPGKLLERAGIQDDAYFALTQVLAPQLAALTRAPGAPPGSEDQAEQKTDRDMANVAMLRFKGKLDKLLPRPAMAASDTGIANGEVHPEAAAANGVHQ
jgi:phosphoglycerol transferase MdoB-like AlkP superfamily enzyme